ncbi:multidrug effflux MFS transporter [Nitratireductor mangrovi]|uniref:Bcr/CflA family efflux transporter n=1 Tax=Nitratireductor mangrovi TaxID=2599600 RepID=A0A5B8KV82_9HYPH|nr:multidrug effflux MFS transporter [Nitratireductor mangrovi]QDY99566.1 multidrug effflux MFS transporter [Nitratireductor mangrovi]
MDQQTARTQAPRLAIPRWEFIAIAAALMALNALAIDVMLPGLQQIGASLGVEDENARQYVITAYITGFGLAQLVFGPVSDRFGRRLPLLIGLGVYVVAAFACVFAPGFGMLLLFRFIQGLGAASTRVISVSIVRDTFGGRAMAEVMSLVFMVFMIVPVVAPGVGQVVLLFFEWPAVFLFIGIVSLVFTVWTWLRLPETLKPEHRRAFTPASIVEGFKIVLSNRLSVCYTIAITGIIGALFGFINSAQQVYVGIYQVGTMFPVYFAAVAGLMALSSFLNSRLVGRFGMRRLAHSALVGFAVMTGAAFLLSLAGPVPFWLFLTLFALAMMQFSWIVSNFNALALEELGHVAGTASSAQGFIQTLGGGVLGAIIGQAFDGTVTPLSGGYFAAALLGLAAVLVAERGRLFQTVNQPV